MVVPVSGSDRPKEVRVGRLGRGGKRDRDGTGAGVSHEEREAWQ